MKKSLFAVSALLVALSVAFTSCGKKYEFTDSNRNTHVAVTDKKGVIKQDVLGNLYEVVTDADGKTKTQLCDFPEALTNKAQTWIENGVFRMKIPKGWYASGLKSEMTLYHSGECTDTGTPHCQLTFSYNKRTTIDVVYADYLSKVKYLTMYSGECSDLKEYETEIFGLKAKAISYKFDKNGVKCYTYFVQNGTPVGQIEAYAYDPCYTEEQLIELLNKNCTLKDLGGEIPTTTTTTTSATEAENVN